MASIEEIREEAVRSRAFIRGAETQLGKVLALIDGPAEPEPLVPGAPGEPKFSVVDSHVLVSWATADRADRYYYSYGPDSPATWGGSTTDTSVTVDIQPGGEFCVIAENEHGRGDMSCAVYAG